jgi:hypothetical protein
MPRPKRNKVAPSAPAPRIQKPAKLAVQIPAMSKASKAGYSELYDISDPEEGLVTSVRRVKKNNGKGNAASRTESESVSVSTPPREQLDIESTAQGIERDESSLPEIDLASSSPAVEVSRRERGTTTVESSMLSIGNFKRRPRQPSILGRAAQARSSSVESNLAGDDGLTSIRRKNTSIMSIGNFKRRPRQPSVLGGVAGAARSSSLGLDMDVGTPARPGSAMQVRNFKKRAREPSIIRTAPKPQWNQDEDEDEDDFNPEDESTPLNLAKSKAIDTSSAASSSNPKKRKLSAVRMPRSSPTLPSPTDSEELEVVPATGPLSGEFEEENETHSSQEEVPIPSIEARSISPEPMSETMAPPRSSSSASSASPPLPQSTQLISLQRPPSRGRRPLRGRTPPPFTQDSPISSPPSLTHSPNQAVTIAQKPKSRKRPTPAPSTFSTAQLQALLPRRRRQTTRDLFDVPSSDDEVDVSGLASDDDELTNLSVRPGSRRQTGLAVRRTPAPKKPAKLKLVTKPKATGKKITYGARGNATYDKENEEHDPDDSLGPLPDGEENDSPEHSQELEQRIGKELKKAARKFEEVDKWEMEFEDVTASSSSPKDAR